MHRAVIALILALATAACAAVVIPTEDEAAAAGESAAAAADAFIGVFEERAAAELETLMSEIDQGAEAESLFPSTTVDPLDTFDPLNDCRWSDASTVTGEGFTVVVPSFVDITESDDDLPGSHAIHSYGRCAPLEGDISVVSTTPASSAQTVVSTQVAAYRSIGDLSIVSDGAVAVPGTAVPGHLIEFRAADGIHRAFLAAPTPDGSVVLITAHAPVAEWADVAPVALDLLNGLSVG